MAPDFLEWWRGPKNSPHVPLRASPDSLGIDDSTCEITTNLSNEFKLPIPPPEQQQRQQLLPTSKPPNPQSQSPFFKLPIEIRNQVYAKLLGNCRIHIDYQCLQLGYKKQRFRHAVPLMQWQWSHYVCPESDSFLKYIYHFDCEREDRCQQNHRGEWIEPKGFPKRETPPGWEGNIRGSNWLRSCQMGYREVMPILYGTNVFVMDPFPDIPLRISRILPLSYLALITAIDLTIEISRWIGPPLNMKYGWERTYSALFHILQHSFPNLRRLRLSFWMANYEEALHQGVVSITPEGLPEGLDQFLRPWETLAASRDWEQLEFCLPESWHPVFKDRLRGPQRYELGTTKEHYQRICDIGW